MTACKPTPPIVLCWPLQGMGLDGAGHRWRTLDSAGHCRARRWMALVGDGGSNVGRLRQNATCQPPIRCWSVQLAAGLRWSTLAYPGVRWVRWGRCLFDLLCVAEATCLPPVPR